MVDNLSHAIVSMARGGGHRYAYVTHDDGARTVRLLWIDGTHNGGGGIDDERARAALTWRSWAYWDEKGPWLSIARLNDDPTIAGDGVVAVLRHGVYVGSFPVYRFPIGWRASSTLDSADAMSQRARASVRRAMHQLP